MFHQDVEDFRRELIGWSQPLIIDQINNHYFASLRGRWEVARDLAIRHYRVWRHVLNDELERAAAEREQLNAALQKAGISPQSADMADRMVFDELMDVIVTRFQRSPALARGYGRTLLDTATSLARTRAAA